MQLHRKERRRFDFADVDGTPGLNVTEFLAFTHPSEVDHMAVRHLTPTRAKPDMIMHVSIHTKCALWVSIGGFFYFSNRILPLRMSWVNMIQIKMDSSAWVNLLETFAAMVRLRRLNQACSLFVLFLVCAVLTFLFFLCIFFQSDGAPSKWEIEETVRFKELYDQDKDGKLNREEQLRWIAPNSYGSAREEVMSSIMCSAFFSFFFFFCL